MKKTRYLPYGYTCRNGKITVERTEAETIRHIFDRYINGASLGELAEELTQKNIPYTEKTTVWNKARISRIIENAKYIGTPEYDPIIDKELYTLAVNCKSARQCNLSVSHNEDINTIRNKVRCGKCGSPMVRNIISKNIIKEQWSCHNPDCGFRIRITDGMLLEKITILLNRIIENRELILPKNDAPVDTFTIYKLKNELDQELARQNPNEEVILSKIRGIASERYRTSNASVMLNAKAIQKNLSTMRPQSTFHPEYFKELIEYLTLGDHGEITLHTKSDTDISERSPNE